MSPVEKYWDGTQYVPILGGISQGTADARYVKKTGDTMTDSLHTTALMLNNPAGNRRWQWYILNPETGGNAGSDLVLGSIADNGAYLDTPIYVYRTGAVFIPKLTASATGVVSPAAGWADLGGPGEGLYVTRIGPLVTMEGMFKPTSAIALTAGQTVNVGTLPSSCWPTHVVYGAGVTSEDDALPHFVRLQIDTAGVLAFRNGPRAYTLPTSGYVGGTITFRGI